MQAKRPTKYHPKPAKKKTVPKHQSLAFQANTVGSGAEKKDSTSNVTAITTTTTGWTPPGASNLLNGIAQGSSETSRVGRKITMRSLLVNWTFGPAITVQGSANCRLTVVYDKQPNGLIPVTTDIFHVDSHLTPMLLANSDRFTVLHNEWVQNPNVNIGGTTIAQMSGSFYVKMLLETMYSGTGATILNINSGALYLLCSSDTGKADVLTYCSRVRFTDS